MIFRRDDLLKDAFYADANLKSVSGATEVYRFGFDRSAGHDRVERIWMAGFSGMEALLQVAPPYMPWIGFQLSRAVKDGRLIEADLFLQIQGDYESDRLSIVRTKLSPGCREDEQQESTMIMAIGREAFNRPLGDRRPVIFSCEEGTSILHKKMTLDFGLVAPGFDPMLNSIQIVERWK